MGLRGRLRQSGSVRDLRENGGRPSEPAVPERPAVPRWLPASARDRCESLIAEAEAAGVPLKRCDGHVFGLVAASMLDYSAARSADERSRIGRDLMAMFDTVGLTPKARQRMGLPTMKRAPELSPTARLLQMAAGGGNQVEVPGAGADGAVRASEDLS